VRARLASELDRKSALQRWWRCASGRAGMSGWPARPGPCASGRARLSGCPARPGPSERTSQLRGCAP
jgi:hypothetical protein